MRPATHTTDAAPGPVFCRALSEVQCRLQSAGSKSAFTLSARFLRGESAFAFPVREHDVASGGRAQFARPPLAAPHHLYSHKCVQRGEFPPISQRSGGGKKKKALTHHPNRKEKGAGNQRTHAIPPEDYGKFISLLA